MVLPEAITYVRLLGVGTDGTKRLVPESWAPATGVSSAMLEAASAGGASFSYEVGVTVAASLAGLVPKLFVARIRKSYSASLVRPDTV